MSTKIYNGVRFKGNLLQVHEYFMKLRPQINALQDEIANRFLANVAVNLIDRAALGIIQPVSCPLIEAYDDLSKRQKDVKTTGRRDPLIDLDFEISILPFKRKVYGMTYIERKELRALMTDDFVEPYMYWDNSDPDEDLSEAEWTRRGKVWDAISAQDPMQRPGMCGFMLSIPYNDKFADAKSVLAYVDPIAARATKLADDIITGTKMKELVGDDKFDWTHFAEANRWSKSDEGRAAAEAEKQRIEPLLPIVTRDILLGR